jgi:hypothetical protein
MPKPDPIELVSVTVGLLLTAAAIIFHLVN